MFPLVRSVTGVLLRPSSRPVYLLDTNVVSELRRSRPHKAVLNWIGEISAERLFLSAVTVGEIQTGIEITREQDTEKADELESWLERVADGYGILPMDARINSLIVRAEDENAVLPAGADRRSAARGPPHGQAAGRPRSQDAPVPGRFAQQMTRLQR